MDKTSCHAPKDFWDWKVTICFYVAVHLVNSHLAKTINAHYRSHIDVNQAINPYNELSPSKVPENIYLAYKKLQGLSRRSRYLVHDNPQNHDSREFLTYDKHYAKAVKNLDKLIQYIKVSYGISFAPCSTSCVELEKTELLHFNVH
ncbi:hypothetical protein [Marinilabilia salmonicolor]|uniref:hypothetical protein n=1 Tax=Marinilabilia salmonicolor TaxID=989 RepID=UPI0011E02BF2|nr:hypothetical protein [Marinilabilia salmonicolor]